MIKLVVGLGNPGQQYEKTRHNAGFLFIDELASGRSAQWSIRSDFQALIAECYFGVTKVLLLKPQTFMNKSGCAVGKVSRYYKIAPEEILVIHDELDFDVGVVKLKKDGGHAGHNGLRDIIVHLKDKNFYRLRIGIGRPSASIAVANYVLSEPTKQEISLLNSSFDKAERFIDEVVTGDAMLAMNKLNA